MLSGILSVVDNILSLDDGRVRTDLTSGDTVTIDCNFSRAMSGRIQGTASFSGLYNVREKTEEFIIICGKHKIILDAGMELHPKPHEQIRDKTSIKLTDKQSRYCEIKFLDTKAMTKWLTNIGDALAKLMCLDALSHPGESNLASCHNLQRCIAACKLLTSPTKPHLQRVTVLYGIRTKFAEAERILHAQENTLSSSDARMLREAYMRYPELQNDPAVCALMDQLASQGTRSNRAVSVMGDIVSAGESCGTISRALAVTEEGAVKLVPSQITHTSSGANHTTTVQHNGAALANAVMVGTAPTFLDGAPTVVAATAAVMSNADGSVADGGHSAEPVPTTISTVPTAPQSAEVARTGISAQVTAGAAGKRKKIQVVFQGMEVKTPSPTGSTGVNNRVRLARAQCKFKSPLHQPSAPSAASKATTPVDKSIRQGVVYQGCSNSSAGMSAVQLCCAEQAQSVAMVQAADSTDRVPESEYSGNVISQDAKAVTNVGACETESGLNIEQTIAPTKGTLVSSTGAAETVPAPEQGRASVAITKPVVEGAENPIASVQLLPSPSKLQYKPEKLLADGVKNAALMSVLAAQGKENRVNHVAMTGTQHVPSVLAPLSPLRAGGSSSHAAEKEVKADPFIVANCTTVSSTRSPLRTVSAAQLAQPAAPATLAALAVSPRRATSSKPVRRTRATPAVEVALHSPQVLPAQAPATAAAAHVEPVQSAPAAAALSWTAPASSEPALLTPQPVAQHDLPRLVSSIVVDPAATTGKAGAAALPAQPQCTPVQAAMPPSTTTTVRRTARRLVSEAVVGSPPGKVHSLPAVMTMHGNVATSAENEAKVHGVVQRVAIRDVLLGMGVLLLLALCRGLMPSGVARTEPIITSTSIPTQTGTTDRGPPTRMTTTAVLTPSFTALEQRLAGSNHRSSHAHAQVIPAQFSALRRLLSLPLRAVKVLWSKVVQQLIYYKHLFE